MTRSRLDAALAGVAIVSAPWVREAETAELADGASQRRRARGWNSPHRLRSHWPSSRRISAW